MRLLSGINRLHCYITLVFLSMVLCKLSAQNTIQKVPVSLVLENITKTHAVSFNYESSLLEGITIAPIATQLS